MAAKRSKNTYQVVFLAILRTKKLRAAESRALRKKQNSRKLYKYI